jgi:tetratricopeptide (TPR) repeat protein
MRRRPLVVGVMISCVAVAGATRVAALGEEAAAPAPDPQAEARALAQTALDHLDAQRFAEALEAAERAEKLYHAPIHMRIIGQALEGLGRLADAAEVYDRLAAEPLPSTAHQLFRDSQELARARIKELAARLPSLLVKVEGGADDATVTIDGRARDARGVAVRVDPGKHVVRVEAPGREPFEQEVVAEEGAGVVVVTAVLREPGSPAVPTEPQRPDDDVADGSGAPPVATWVLFGIGGAALVAAGATGGLSLSQGADLEERCPDRRCTPADQDDYDQAVALGWASTALFVVGGIGVASGVVVWVVDASAEPDSDADATAAVPRIGLRPGAVELSWAF